MLTKENLLEVAPNLQIPNLSIKLNLEKKHSQFRLHPWHLHQLQKELKIEE